MSILPPKLYSWDCVSENERVFAESTVYAWGVNLLQNLAHAFIVEDIQRPEGLHLAEAVNMLKELQKTLEKMQ